MKKITPPRAIGMIHALLYHRLPMRTSGIRALTGGICLDHSATTIRSSAGLSPACSGSGEARGSGVDDSPAVACAGWGLCPLPDGPAGWLMQNLVTHRH